MRMLTIAGFVVGRSEGRRHRTDRRCKDIIESNPSCLCSCPAAAAAAAAVSCLSLLTPGFGDHTLNVFGDLEQRSKGKSTTRREK